MTAAMRCSPAVFTPAAGSMRLSPATGRTSLMVSQARADALLAAAKKLDEAPLTKQQMEAKEKAAKESNRHKRESNGEGSVIDQFNQRTTIENTLRQAHYTQLGARWVRPGGKNPSVTVEKGRSFHHHSNDRMNDGYWHRPFDIFCEYWHNGDVKAAVKAAAEKLGIKKEKKTAKKKTGETTIDTEQGRTEVANAKRLVAMHGPDMRFCDAFGTWFNFDGVRWKADDRRQAERRGKEVYQALWAEYANCAKQKDVDQDEVAAWITNQV